MRFRLRSGLALGYKTRGAGPVVALLHPIALDARFWEPTVAFLAPFCRTLSIEVRGHGESDVPPEAFSLPDLVSDCAELISTLSPQPALVVGCSLGGALAQGLAILRPDLVRGLVLANCSGPRPEAANQPLLERAKAAETGMAAVVDTTISRWFSPAFAEQHHETVAQTREWLMAADPTVHSWTWRAMATRAFSSRLSEIRAPALAVAGALDASAKPDSVKLLAQSIAGAEYEEVEGAGHLTPLEQPQEFSRLVCRFLQRLPDMPASKPG